MFLAYLIWNWHLKKWGLPRDLNPGLPAPQTRDHTPVMLLGQRFRTHIGLPVMT